MKKAFTYKECEIIMLPTENALKQNSVFCIDEKVYLCDDVFSTLYKYREKIKPQHLYALLDDEIKVGDWIFVATYGPGGIIERVTKVSKVDNEVIINAGITKNKCKKIIASTDLSLKLPGISNESIKIFIDVFNNTHEEIPNFLVKCEEKVAMDGHTIVGLEYSKLPDGTISIIENIEDIKTKNMKKCLTYKECEIIMLPTKESHLTIVEMEGEQLLFDKYYLYYEEEDYYQPQHLYILSDEEIKEGDWALHKNPFYAKDKGHIEKPIKCSKSNCFSIQEHWRKIIASTDPELKLPRISTNFLERFVKKSNSNEKIFHIQAECEEFSINGEVISIVYKKFSDGTIAIIEDASTVNNFPRNIIENMLKYCEDQAIYDKLGNYDNFYYKAKQWLSENK